MYVNIESRFPNIDYKVKMLKPECYLQASLN